MAIISFGRIDKKLNIIAILAIVRLINLTISKKFQKNIQLIFCVQ